MSKTLAREQQFDTQRRARLEVPLNPVKEPQEPASTATSVVAVELPAPATEYAVEKLAPRWISYLLITILLLPFFNYLLRGQVKPNAVIGPGPSLDSAQEKPAVELPAPPVAAAAPLKQMFSTRSVPPTLRFSAVGAIHEPKKAAESGRLLLPPTLRLLGVSSPLDLVSTQPFVLWEKPAAPVLPLPQQAVQSHPLIVAAISDSSQLAAVSSTLRALKLMDTAIASAKRVAASENKKPGD